MNLKVGASTDVGLVRDHNEDSYLAGASVFAVADGLGGHQGGEVASRIAVETLERAMTAVDGRDDSTVPERLLSSILTANGDIFQKAEADPNLQGMGTTITAMVAGRGRMFLAHVGDSRAYLLRDDELRTLTEDHTLVHRMVTEGQITEDEAAIHPRRSILTRALGIEDEIEVDQATVEVTAGDRLLLCSDGLTGMVNDEGIVGILRATSDPQEASDRLVHAAVEAGGADNVTAVVLDVIEAEAPPPTVEVTPERAAPREAPAASASGPRRRWPRRLLKIGLALAVIAGLLFGAKAYVDRQWFVGVESGNVALFRGIPATPLGIDLSTVVERTTIPAAQATALEPWRELGEGITAGSEEEAREILEQIRADVGTTPPAAT